MDTRKRQIIMRLRDHFDLTSSGAEAILEEVLDALDETVDEFVQSRHQELQRQGLSNAEIFAQLTDEVSGLRFASSPLSERQLRRRVYG